jgi:hypothetical protein
VDGATIKIEEITGQLPIQIITTSNGSFIAENIPAAVGDRVRLYVSKKGFREKNLYVVIPGPVNVQLEKQ